MIAETSAVFSSYTNNGLNRLVGYIDFFEINIKVGWAGKKIGKCLNNMIKNVASGE